MTKSLTVCVMTVNEKVQEMILAALAELGVDEQVVIPPGVLGTQWELVVTCPEKGRLDLTHRNPAGDGTERWKFFAWATTGNKYGAGIIVQEPSLGIPCREAGIDMDGNLVGVVCFDDDGKLLFRGSWSKCVWGVNPGDRTSYSFSPEGEVFIGSESRGFVHKVFLPDEMRMKGWVAIALPSRPAVPVQVGTLNELTRAYAFAAQ